MRSGERWKLVSDIGGTNVRFGRADEDGSVYARRSYKVSEFPGFNDAIARYLPETGGFDGCIGAVIGAAGPVFQNCVKLTNANWTITCSEVAALIDRPVMLVNDLEAAARVIPQLRGAELQFIGPARQLTAKPERVLAANIGTGFGAATLIRSGAGWVSCPSEAGHISLDRRLSDGTVLPAAFKTIETVLSGSGLSNLYDVLWSDGAAPTSTRLSSAEILEQIQVESGRPSSRGRFSGRGDPEQNHRLNRGLLRFARNDDDSAAADEALASADNERANLAVRIFSDVFAQALGNLVLAVAAWNGVFVFGSVAREWARIADHSRFRSIFEDKGAMQQHMARVPIAIVTAEDVTLAGLAAIPVA